MAHFAKFTDARKQAFLEALAEQGTVTSAAAVVGLSRRAAYQHRRKDEVFAEAWTEARETFADNLEMEARRRAVEGIEQPVFHGGVQVGTQRVYSDKLLMMLLRANRPEKYAERRKTHVIADSPAGSLVIQIEAAQDNKDTG